MVPGYSFPYTESGALNMDWLLDAMRKAIDKVDNFVSINTIKYADPIQWNIESQYEKNTVVVDRDGNAWLSVQPVPAGVSLDRTEYWTKIGNFDALWGSVKNAITPFDEGMSTTASANRSINTMVWLDNVLYRCTQYMQSGTAYVEGVNCVKSSLNEVFAYIMKLSLATYDAENQSLILGYYSGPEIVTAGDTHVYIPGTETIKIVDN